MAEKLLSPAELRARARRHRETAMAAEDPQRRKLYVLLAKEFDDLAAAMEAEGGLSPRRQRAPS